MQVNAEFNGINCIYPKYLTIFIVLFTASWLIATILAVKSVSFFGVTLTGGFILFPITTILNILIVETYGYKNARQALWCGTIVNLLYVISINLINIFPPAPEWKLDSEFKAILVPHTRLILASVVSFWLSGFLNSYLIAKLKCNEFGFFFRIFLASFFSISFDIGLYLSLGFLGSIPFDLFKKILFFAFIKKIFIELFFLPFVWKLIDIFKEFECFEFSDNQTNFTPFSFDNVYILNNYRHLKKAS